MERCWRFAEGGAKMTDYRLAKILIFIAFFLGGCGIGGVWLDPGNAPSRPGYPYGAHWVKDGMTRQSRLDDLHACGIGRSVHFGGFSQASIRAETQPGDTVSVSPTNKEMIRNPQAELRLGRKLMACMQAKGYIWFDSCDARCLYP